MNLSWIHLENLKFFIFLGNTEAEQMIGQNITINLSLCVPYKNTKDNIENAIDYALVYECLSKKMKSLERVKLLEFLLDILLCEIQTNFPKIHSAKLSIQKSYVPLPNFTGTARIEATRIFNAE